MNINIDKSNGIPIYIQIKEEITNSINNGSIVFGEKLPTERQLSEALKVSRNTVSKAYEELEQNGIVKSYTGKGTFVAENENYWRNETRRGKIIRMIDLGIEEALTDGFSFEDYLNLVQNRVEEKKALLNKYTLIYVECNIEQAKMFSKELRALLKVNMIPLTIEDLKSESKEVIKYIKSSQGIVTTFNHLDEVKKLTKGYGKDIFGVAINADLETIVKIARFPKETKLACICISDIFMYKIQTALLNAGISNLKISYSNTKDETELKDIIEDVDAVIVSPGRRKDIEKFSFEKNIIEFLFKLDKGSVNILKSKLIETT